MSSTIATGHGEYGENRLIEAPEGTDNTYRLDVDGIKIMFDTVNMSSSRQTFTFEFNEHTTSSVDADVLSNRVEGALSVLSRNC